MFSLKRFNHWSDNLVFESYRISSENLAVYRILFSLYVLIFHFPVFSWISGHPDIFFDPPRYSLGALFEGFPPVELFVIIDLVLVTLCFFLLFGYKTGITSASITVLWLIGYSFQYSFSKIDHNILIVILPFVMSASGWGDRFSIDANSGTERKQDYRSAIPVLLMALLIGFGYFSAGYAKIFTWLDFDTATHGVRSWALNAFFVSNKEALLLPELIQITNPYFWEALDITAIIFEITFIFSVLNQKLFRIYLCIGVVFHFVNTLMLLISFQSMMILYLLFFELDRVRGYFTFNWKTIFSFKWMMMVLLPYLLLYLIVQKDLSIHYISIPELVLSPLLENPEFFITHFIMIVAFSIVVFTATKNIPRIAGKYLS